MRMKIRMSKIKAILFDMDKVLLKAKEWYYEALSKVMNLPIELHIFKRG